MSDLKQIRGIHHVTAIAGDPQRNIDYYAGILGLRLVKLTVNFDDPNTYHLYYGDELGHPGTILTFFPWPTAPSGRLGTGQLTTTSFSITDNSIDFWTDRLRTRKVPFQGPMKRFDEEVISFLDPDGLQLELVAHPAAADRDGWKDGLIPAENAIRGFHLVTLSEQEFERTESLLIDSLGFRQVCERGNRVRFEVGDGGPGALADVLSSPGLPRGSVAVGSVHHAAWRTPDDEQQKSWRKTLLDLGLNVTPVMDRKYFHSIYFREPGGVLFEIATEPPGFTVDEPAEQSGSELRLPPWLEPHRSEIETALPRVRLPALARVL